MMFQRMLAAGVAVSALVLAAPSQAANTHVYPVHPIKGRVGSGDMLYYGGSVFSDVKVVVVIWNKDVLQTTKDQIPLFSQAIVDSTYLDQLKEYKTKGVTAVNGHASTNQTIDRGAYIGEFQLKPHNKKTTLTDRMVQKELKRQIAEGNLPQSDANMFYMIYFPANIHIDNGGGLSCQAFGAYHSSTNAAKVSKKNVFYSIEPECNGGLASLTVAAHMNFPRR